MGGMEERPLKEKGEKREGGKGGAVDSGDRGCMLGAAEKWEGAANSITRNILAPPKAPSTVLTDGFHHQSPVITQAAWRCSSSRRPVHVTCLRGHHCQVARAVALSTMSHPCGHQSHHGGTGQCRGQGAPEAYVCFLRMWEIGIMALIMTHESLLPCTARTKHGELAHHLAPP